MKLTRYTCGHIGRTNESPDSKVQAFIRVAEIRDNPVFPSEKNCPDCNRSE